jgi:hypothetical protein
MVTAIKEAVRSGWQQLLIGAICAFIPTTAIAAYKVGVFSHRVTQVEQDVERGKHERKEIADKDAAAREHLAAAISELTAEVRAIKALMGRNE